MANLFNKNETDIALLRRCIEEKWIHIYAGKLSDRGIENCPLCQHYGDGCKSCPIQEDTGHLLCNSTPYEIPWMNIAGIDKTADTPERKLAALEEITYLEGLITKLTKAEEIEKEKEKRVAEIQARIEKAKKVLSPFVYYLTLEEPVENYEFRLELARKVQEFLKEQGVKVKQLRYGYESDHHLVFSQKDEVWEISNTRIIRR